MLIVPNENSARNTTSCGSASPTRSSSDHGEESLSHVDGPQPCSRGSPAASERLIPLTKVKVPPRSVPSGARTPAVGLRVALAGETHRSHCLLVMKRSSICPTKIFAGNSCSPFQTWSPAFRCCPCWRSSLPGEDGFNKSRS